MLSRARRRWVVVVVVVVVVVALGYNPILSWQRVTEEKVGADRIRLIEDYSNKAIKRE